MRRRTLLMALPLTAVLASCGVASRAGKGSSAGASAGASNGGFEVTDVVGRKVTFSAQPKRIVLSESRHVYSLAFLNKTNPIDKVVAWGEDLQKAAPDFYEKILSVAPKAADLPKIGNIAKDGLPIETVGEGGEALAAMLDIDVPFGIGDPVPPLWHWMYLLDRRRQSELGDDVQPQGGVGVAVQLDGDPLGEVGDGLERALARATDQFVSVSAGMRDLWVQCFYSHDRIVTSAPFAARLGLCTPDTHALPFMMGLYLACCMSSTHGAIYHLGFRQARQLAPLRVGDTYRQDIQVRQVRNTADGKRAVVTTHRRLVRVEDGVTVLALDKRELYHRQPESFTPSAEAARLDAEERAADDLVTGRAGRATTEEEVPWKD